HIDGTLDWQGGDAPLQLDLRGTDVLVSDTRELRAIASPDLRVSYRAGQALELTGEVVVPEARIDLEGLDQGVPASPDVVVLDLGGCDRGVAASPDVVVLDPVDPEAEPGAPLAMDLLVILGEDVRIEGFGLEGGLDGRVRILARPGRQMLARGSLDVSGEYTA